MKSLLHKKHQFLIAALAVLYAALVSLGSTLAAGNVENKRDQAIKLYGAKNYKDAGRLLDEHLTVYPQDIFALYYDALSCQALGNMGKAKIYYRQVATIAPNHQLGSYARTILKQIDPAFVPPQASAKTSPMPNLQTAPGLAIQGQSTLDRSIPYEWDVPCTIEEDNVWVDVQLNGHRIKMIFDTGAPSVAIGKNQMAEIGMEAPKTRPEGKTGGASSSEKTSYWIVPTRVKVGCVEKTVDLEVLENNQADPLLGQSYAGLFECTVDAGAKRIHFKQRGYDKSKNRNAYEVPYIYQEDGNRVLVNVDINGKIGQCIFDTGNTSAGISFNNATQAKKYGVTIPEDAITTTTGGVTGEGRCKQFSLRRVRLGPVDKVDLTVNVSEITDDDEPPLLGAPFWQGFEYTINRQKKVIEFVRR